MGGRVGVIIIPVTHLILAIDRGPKTPFLISRGPTLQDMIWTFFNVSIFSGGNFTGIYVPSMFPKCPKVVPENECFIKTLLRSWPTSFLIPVAFFLRGGSILT